MSRDFSEHRSPVDTSRVAPPEDLSTTGPFARSDAEFFHQDLTRSCLLRLARSEALTIYCGAGVTIDRTGYGWGGLIGSAFSPDASAHRSHPTNDEISILQHIEDPLRLASILTQYAHDNHPHPVELADYITPILQNRLYQTRVWQAGRLTRNVCSVAVACAILGIEIDIVTANYDTYIEDAFVTALGRFGDTEVSGELAPGLPGLRVLVYRADDVNPIEVAAAAVNRGAENVITLHYLHGRIPPAGGADGDLVVSEIDYATSRARTECVLARYVTENRALLILGASLTDPPLVNALADSRPGGEIANSARFALMPRSSFRLSDLPARTNSRIVSHMSKRAELLGLRLLVPDFKIQVAQFCQELSSCIESDDAELFMSDNRRCRYGLRLVDWWSHWKGSALATDPLAMFKRLDEWKQTIESHVRDSAGPSFDRDTQSEIFRLEIWLREEPSERKLAMWGSTMGPIVDSKTRRRAGISVDTANASVMALIEGRPQHIDGAELVHDRRAARWNSYLCVPYFARTEVGRLPVGVVTLASTARGGSSVLPLANVAHMEALRDHMIRCGASILEVDGRRL